ncbi:hypothetical protein ACFL5V_03030 [Fibrobacterota bacterium]
MKPIPLYKRVRSLPALTVLTCLFLGASGTMARKPKHQLPQREEKLGTLAIMDLVDLSNNRTIPTLSNKLRIKLTRLKRWDVLSRDKLKEVLGKYDKDLNTACNNPQCAFEYGSLIQTNYLLYGTATRFRGIGILTLKLLNVHTAKIVWSRILSSKSGTSAMEATFSTLKYELSLATIKDKQDDRNILAIMDLSDGSLQAKILFERIITHAYSNDHYKVMSQTEVDELTSVLEIKPESILSSVDNMGEIGDKLGANYVLFSQFKTTGINYKHSMVLYDVEEKSVLLSMPPQPQASFWDMLVMEKNFFTGLARLKTLKLPPSN